RSAGDHSCFKARPNRNDDRDRFVAPAGSERTHYALPPAIDALFRKRCEEGCRLPTQYFPLSSDPLERRGGRMKIIVVILSLILSMAAQAGRESHGVLPAEFQCQTDNSTNPIRLRFEFTEAKVT